MDPIPRRLAVVAVRKVLLAFAAVAVLSGSALAGPQFAVHLDNLLSAGSSVPPLPGVTFGYELPVGPVAVGLKVRLSGLWVLIVEYDGLAYLRAPMPGGSLSLGGGVGGIGAMTGSEDYWSLYLALQGPIHPGLDGVIEFQPTFPTRDTADLYVGRAPPYLRVSFGFAFQLW